MGGNKMSNLRNKQIRLYFFQYGEGHSNLVSFNQHYFKNTLKNKWCKLHIHSESYPDVEMNNECLFHLLIVVSDTLYQDIVPV